MAAFFAFAKKNGKHFGNIADNVLYGQKSESENAGNFLVGKDLNTVRNASAEALPVTRMQTIKTGSNVRKRYTLPPRLLTAASFEKLIMFLI